MSAGFKQIFSEMQLFHVKFAHICFIKPYCRLLNGLNRKNNSEGRREKIGVTYCFGIFCFSKNKRANSVLERLF